VVALTCDSGGTRGGVGLAWLGILLEGRALVEWLDSRGRGFGLGAAALEIGGGAGGMMRRRGRCCVADGWIIVGGGVTS
jgi:hypothetical protein